MAIPGSGRLYATGWLPGCRHDGQSRAIASVTLADRFGNAITSAITDGAGNFSLAPSGFIPAPGRLYFLEAAKSLGQGAPGKAMARFRTVLQWSGAGWLSVSGATESSLIVLNPLTTAVAIEAGLDPANVPLEKTLGKVDATVTPHVLRPTPAFVGHPDGEISALAQAIVDFVIADQDPVGAVAGIAPTITALGSGGVTPDGLATDEGFDAEVIA